MRRYQYRMVSADHARELTEGERFKFGANWARFLSKLDDDRIAEAERSLRDMLGVQTLAGQRFLDIGSGSGIFSLAARRLGARVHSFDYDSESVACTAELRRRFFPNDPSWTVEQGSVLDDRYVARLGTFDVVYAWGVLHHTGDMRRALHNAQLAVAPGGQLFIAIYNFQVYWTALSTRMKRAYVRSPRPGKWLIAGAFFGVQAARAVTRNLLLGRNPVRRAREYGRNRGMSPWHDCVDWVGGYPFEAAKPEEIFDFYRQRGFSLERMTTCGGGHGCNQFVFRRAATDGSPAPAAAARSGAR
jgi:2-polyprenyl-6-hydroxyphenyl methylase/3-demethylubiquinone-9 3-methyltransferase